MHVKRCVVDNRVFLLGLDYLYREAMKGHERGELLACARCVATTLGVAAADAPIEGYYAEDADLTAYFRLVRALQAVAAERRNEVESLAEFRRLHEVASAPLYGRAEDTGKLLPAGRDPLTQALEDTWPDWSVANLTSAAAACARDWDDFSLVGLAARSGDPVVLTALRESVVLYAQVIFGMTPSQYEYVWQVDPALAAQSSRFIDAFNALFGNALPPAAAAEVEYYWRACAQNHYVGRCVRLGIDDSIWPPRHYHWALRRDEDHNPIVHEFWDTEIWTTQRYGAGLGLRESRSAFWPNP